MEQTPSFQHFYHLKSTGKGKQVDVPFMILDVRGCIPIDYPAANCTIMFVCLSVRPSLFVARLYILSQSAGEDEKASKALGAH